MLTVVARLSHVAPQPVPLGTCPIPIADSTPVLTLLAYMVASALSHSRKTYHARCAGSGRIRMRCRMFLRRIVAAWCLPLALSPSLYTPHSSAVKRRVGIFALS